MCWRVCTEKKLKTKKNNVIEAADRFRNKQQPQEMWFGMVCVRYVDRESGNVFLSVEREQEADFLAQTPGENLKVLEVSPLENPQNN